LAEERVHYEQYQYVTDDVLWLLADAQGTVRDVAQYDPATDTTEIVNHLRYGSFGQILGQTEAGFEPEFTYTGRQYDADSGLYYYRARWYDAQNGRFINEDPLGFAAGDTNLSRYCGNSPTNFVDPDGTTSKRPESYTKPAPKPLPPGWVYSKASGDASNSSGNGGVAAEHNSGGSTPGARVSPDSATANNGGVLRSEPGKPLIVKDIPYESDPNGHYEYDPTKDKKPRYTPEKRPGRQVRPDGKIVPKPEHGTTKQDPKPGPKPLPVGPFQPYPIDRYPVSPFPNNQQPSKLPNPVFNPPLGPTQPPQIFPLPIIRNKYNTPQNLIK
jgi:RHS repeat-associated protein